MLPELDGIQRKGENRRHSLRHISTVKVLNSKRLPLRAGMFTLFFAIIQARALSDT